MSRTHPKPRTWTSSDVAWKGRRRPYDLAREFLVSFSIVAVLVLGLTLLFASPDPPPMTFQEWATQGTVDFAKTTLTEIDETSEAATYGPPYQSTAQNGNTQGFGWFSPQTWLGNLFPPAIPINTWKDFVATPLLGANDPAAASAVDTWNKASASQQTDWSNAYSKALADAKASNGHLQVTDSPAYGPLNTLVQAQIRLAEAGGLDAALSYTNATALQGGTVWYSNDQTRSLLYFGDSGQGGDAPDCVNPGDPLPAGDGCWFYNQAVANTSPRNSGYLAGDTWGIMNEVGNWPGAWWLFPYTFWYQWGYGADGASADLFVIIMTVLFALPFIFLPWIPGLRDIPKATRVYRLMWRDHYRRP